MLPAPWAGSSFSPGQDWRGSWRKSHHSSAHGAAEGRSEIPDQERHQLSAGRSACEWALQQSVTPSPISPLAALQHQPALLTPCWLPPLTGLSPFSFPPVKEAAPAAGQRPVTLQSLTGVTSLMETWTTLQARTTEFRSEAVWVMPRSRDSSWRITQAGLVSLCLAASAPPQSRDFAMAVTSSGLPVRSSTPTAIICVCQD